MILGLPWLVKNNPLINWNQGTLQWPAENLDFEKVTTHFIDPIEDEENLHIYRAKLSETFHQMYGTERETPQTIEDMVPKEYYPYLAIFDKETSERFPPSRSCDHEINLKPDFKPKRIPPYSLNPEETKLAKEFIDENMAKGYIRESNSKMASPLFFVGKKDGSKRPCQDYRLLNEGMIKDSFPIPRITDLLRILQKAKLFTKLDIRWGYNNIQIKEADRHKAAFSTPTGLYEPNVMFFGLCNSPATFQRMMNEIFEEEIFEGWCLIYMDDILILSETKKEDNEWKIRRHLNRLLKDETIDDPKWKLSWTGKQLLLFKNGKRYIPNDLNLRRRILRDLHDHETAGHPGVYPTYLRVSQDYWWPGLPHYVRKYVQGCPKCQQNKIDWQPWKGPLQPIPNTSETRPFAQISMDLLTDLPPSEQGFDTLLVIADHGLTKGIILAPTTKEAKAADIAELLRDYVFKCFGLPEKIISDRDP